MKKFYFTKSLILITISIVVISCALPMIATSYNPYASKKPVNKVSMNDAKAKITNILNNNLKRGILVKDTLSKHPFSVKNVDVTDDGINFIGKKEQQKLLFSDLYGKTIYGKGYANNPFDIVIPKIMTITLVGDVDHVTLMDYFSLIQRKLMVARFNSNLKAFEPEAAAYRNLKMKPPVSEDQRKFIVQANALNEQKRYYEAIEQYVKALKLDPTGYPAGYFNIALLDAQLGYYDSAIYEMKKYLMLVPDASDARSAQDKIYEWEINATE